MLSVKTILFPELTRFPTRAARKHAWKRAEKAILRRPLWWVLMIAALTAFGIIAFSLATLGIPLEWRGRVRGIMMLLATWRATRRGSALSVVPHHALFRELAEGWTQEGWGQSLISD